MIQISKPQIGEEEIQAVSDVLKSGIIASGPKVKEFEKDYLAILEAQYKDTLETLKKGIIDDNVTDVLEKVAKQVAEKYSTN